MDALVGTFLGAVLAIVGGIVAKSYDEWRARKSLRAAFRAEVFSIMENFELRGHDRMFEDLIRQWKQYAKLKPRLLGSLEKPVDPIFSKNSDKIGLLGRDVAGELVRFYAIADGIREDIKILGDGEMDHLSGETKVRLMEADLKLLGEAKEIAAELSRKL